MPLDITKKTFQLSTQNARTPASFVMNKTHSSPFPALNVKCISEAVEKYSAYCDAPAIDNSSMCTQVFVGTRNILTDDSGMKHYKKFVIV